MIRGKRWFAKGASRVCIANPLNRRSLLTGVYDVCYGWVAGLWRYGTGLLEANVMNRWRGKYVVAAVALTCCGVFSVCPASGEVVRFQTTDGLEIVGDYRPAAAGGMPAPVAIMLHMYGSDRSSWKPLMEPLHVAGFATLAIDLRGHGESGAPRKEALHEMIKAGAGVVFRDMVMDVEAARQWLALRDDIDQARIALVGASIGCSVAINYAAQDVSVDVVVAMTPGTGYFGVDSTIPMRMLGSRPVLLLATEHERQACDKLAGIQPHATKRILGKMTAHGTRMFQAMPGVKKMIVDFLTGGVGQRSPAPVVSVSGSAVFFRSLKALAASTGPVNRKTVRWFNSADEATSRGLHAAQSD